MRPFPSRFFTESTQVVVTTDRFFKMRYRQIQPVAVTIISTFRQSSFPTANLLKSGFDIRRNSP
jgi:hypothetical protein